MAENNFERIIFCQDNYDNDRNKLFEAVSTQLRLLLDAGYVAVVRYDEPGLGIVVIEFQHDEHAEPWGVWSPVWISPEEEEKIWIERDEVNDKN